MTCPTCLGAKQSTAIVCSRTDRGTRSEWRNLPCHTCRGAGEVDARQAALIETGRRLRDHRVNVLPYRSQREEATRLGMSVLHLSKQEQGRICAACPAENEGSCAVCPYTAAEAEGVARERGRL